MFILAIITEKYVQEKKKIQYIVPISERVTKSKKVEKSC